MTTKHSSECVRPRGFSRAAMTPAGTIADPHARIRTILNDKSILEHVRLLPRQHWAKKDDQTNCVFCERKFRTFSRKVHCRCCGQVVCSSCYRKKDVRIGLETELVRLCFDCIDHALTPTVEELTDDDSLEGSFTNSGRVTLSACSSHMKFVDGLLIDTAHAPGPTDNFVNLELSQYDYDSDAGDTDRESVYSYDSDDDESLYSSGSRSGRSSYARSLRGSTTSTLSSSGSGRSSSVHHGLGFVPEESNLGDFVNDMKLALSDLEVDPETRRQQLLNQYNVESLSCQREFDALCQLVSRALHGGVAAVAFMGDTMQWYKSKIGISQSELPRDVAFCSQLLEERSPTVVLDATKDPRFRENPLVTGSAHIRFYASAPICDPKSKIVLGSVFVMDPLPKLSVPARAMEVLTYASAAAEKLLLSEGKRAKRHRARQKRKHRVFSDPKLVHGNDEDEQDTSKADSLRGGALWTSEPPSCGSGKARSSHGPGIELLDLASLTTLKSASRRASAAAADAEKEPMNVLGRSAPPKITIKTPPTSTPIDMRDEIRQQLETTRQLLFSYAPRRRKPSIAESTATEAEVEV